MIYILLAYFALLLTISRMIKRKDTATAFFRGERQSPWYMVAFGMVGASISGVSFVSVPGMVLHSGFTYLEVCAGFIGGYFVVAYVLLPIYYKHNVTTIYTYLRRISDEACKTGSAFFVISKLLGAAAKFYVPCFIISRVADCDFTITVCLMLFLVWLYTRRGGIKTLEWTDTVQTLCMMVCLALLIANIGLDIWPTLPHSLGKTGYTWQPGGFALRFLSGVFIVIVMTGLDQDMMQKNLTCRTLRDAQKDMCTYGFAFLPVNALFMLLGVMLIGVYNSQGTPLPDNPDDLLTLYCLHTGGLTLTLFVLGVVATSFSTVDSAITALTTTVCVDFLSTDGKGGKQPSVGFVHLFMTLLVAVCCVLFHHFNTTSLIDAVYILVSYTYGPLLGLFAYAMTHKPRQRKRDGSALVCILSPLLCLVLNHVVTTYSDYRFGYEMLLINGLITYAGLWITGKLSGKTDKY